MLEYLGVHNEHVLRTEHFDEYIMHRYQIRHYGVSVVVFIQLFLLHDLIPFNRGSRRLTFAHHSINNQPRQLRENLIHMRLHVRLETRYVIRYQRFVVTYSLLHLILYYSDFLQEEL